METPTQSKTRGAFHMPPWLGVCLFLVIAAFLLLEEHRAHIFGLLPYALLLLCPVIHLFMHRGHGRSTDAGHESSASHPGGVS